MSSVPRVAAFDDLRVGQKVALLHPQSTERVATVTRIEDGYVWFDDKKGVTPRFWQYDGEVVILRDAPAPPVQVRREDYDALLTAMEPLYGCRPSECDALLDAAHTMIVNAEVPVVRNP